MSKLTKAQAKLHKQACDLLMRDALTFDERWFVLENWQESASHINSAAGAFFTPMGLASDFSLFVGGGRIIDLCAGIGMLSFHVWRHAGESQPVDITCVEVNPDYVAVGRKVLPEATWICADVTEVLDAGIGQFDCAISNPPFGRIPRGGSAPRYTGSEFELHVVDIAAHLADYGLFILPQESAGFQFSGDTHYKRATDGRAQRFQDLTGLRFECAALDASFYRNAWRGVAPKVEVVSVDFEHVVEDVIAQTVCAEAPDLFSVGGPPEMARPPVPPTLALDLPMVAPPPPAPLVRLPGWYWSHLEPHAYGLIYIDPPWKQEFYDEESGIEKAPQAHYDCMSLDEVKTLPVGQLAAQNCFVVMWSMWNFVAPGYATEVLRAWGFEPKAGGAWMKHTKTGKLTFGTGYGFRGCCEPFLTASIGSPTVMSRSERNGILTEIPADSSAPELALNALFDLLREHSRKPDEMRHALERMFPYVRKAEIFAREAKPGWEAWGDQVGHFQGGKVA